VGYKCIDFSDVLLKNALKSLRFQENYTCALQ